ncbi:MBL fold metallo-hydrolase [Acetobacterium wieringae]|jgi:glyoxylase-like metal-dependent hydrolase (beta-lactamase superfamily II)|uniref:MBL fold metallo-hydrolase n=1 Tax=Acetobacterium wieringae TaxID=52694 RepID=A0ABY6HA88_9FIRM|nr:MULTISPECIES: MBL fold metallo-hydrolase [Acetobacterium]MEA4804749.1 MBL fold metallo-hydrolase [Acetobacterium wieringae]UYO61409.1 MBL fold metallo-hydrolase [Acetobacterium wieringae]VUZ28676.1 Hydroxyacylglutathione hydrolase GloC [Acetobacterium wieringae]HAZ06737.1 MBL fold metallo-hydrolase [Acetobacterium sp.]
MEVIKKSLGQMGTNCYVVWDENTLEAAVVDPGFEDQQIGDIINDNKLKVKYILLTHGHFDHLGGVNQIKQLTGAKVLIHENDADCLVDPKRNLSALAGIDMVLAPADGYLNENETITLGEIVIRIIHTPGHSKGGVCFLADGQLIAGDTLFNTSIGRTDFADGDLSELLNAIEMKLFILDDATIVLPGHGGNTTIGYEKMHNPFLKGRF